MVSRLFDIFESVSVALIQGTDGGPVFGVEVNEGAVKGIVHYAIDATNKVVQAMVIRPDVLVPEDSTVASDGVEPDALGSELIRCWSARSGVKVYKVSAMSVCNLSAEKEHLVIEYGVVVCCIRR